MVGLGCEVNAIRGLVDEMGLPASTPLAEFTIQGVGGTAAAVKEGVRQVNEMAERLRGTARTPVGVEHLVFGMQCGGSDAWSALTANPALGVASDYLVALGATSMLGETPEIYGAEQLLAERAVHPGVRDRLMERIRWWESYTASQGATLDGNPSPGNKAGGITTILEKSLGSVAKGGRSPLAEIVDYAAAPTGRGFVFMDTPGYDPVSATGMVAGGANIIAFTTGRGSVFGSRPAPTVKLATNSALATSMTGDIDIDCSGIVETDRPLLEVGEQVYRSLVEVASGRPVHERGARAGRRGDRALADRSRAVTRPDGRPARPDHRGRAHRIRRAEPAGAGVPGQPVGIVHLGIGAFHRAHQAVYTEDAMLAAGTTGGASAGSPNARPPSGDQLLPQDGLYGVLQKSSTEPTSLRITGAVREVLDGSSQVDALLDRLAAARTALVTLTVTEKGYRRARTAGWTPPTRRSPRISPAPPSRPARSVGWFVGCSGGNAPTPGRSPC